MLYIFNMPNRIPEYLFGCFGILRNVHIYFLPAASTDLRLPASVDKASVGVGQLSLGNITFRVATHLAVRTVC
jgi:hypothetical protein